MKKKLDLKASNLNNEIFYVSFERDYISIFDNNIIFTSCQINNVPSYFSLNWVSQ